MDSLAKDTSALSLLSTASRDSSDNEEEEEDQPVDSDAKAISPTSSRSPSPSPSTTTLTEEPLSRESRSPVVVAAESESTPSPMQRRKKRPAPAPPTAVRRTVCGSLQQIQFDLNAIGDRLAVIQERVSHLEGELTRHTSRVNGIPCLPPLDRPSLESVVNEFLELSRETCTLARRQEELMYQRTEHKLEQEHADLEFQIRSIDLIPDFKRTEEDAKRSRDLISRLVDVIDRRNDVVESMTRIDKRSV